MDKQEVIRRLTLAAENMAREYKMRPLATKWLDSSTIAYFNNVTPHAINLIRIGENDNGDLTFSYRIVTLYNTYFCEMTFVNDEKQLWLPTDTEFLVNGKDIGIYRHTEADLIYVQFEWELHLQFDKERIEELEREYAKK